MSISRRIQAASQLLIFAGAGISQESGLATFRAADGLWEQYPVMEICNYPKYVKDCNTGNAAARQRVFEFYNMRKKGIRAAQPNKAHLTIAALQQKYGVDRVKIVTSNIDDLFERAGCQNVVHVHGTVDHQQCVACGEHHYIGQDDFDFDMSCPTCGSHFMKPSVVFFGENAPEYYTMSRIFSEYNRYNEDVLMYIGSSMSVVHPHKVFGSDVKIGHRVLVDTNANELYEHSWNYFDEKFQMSAVEFFNTIEV